MNTPPDGFLYPNIIHCVYQFYLTLHSYGKLFPKPDRHVIGQQCQNLTLELLKLFFTANSETNRERFNSLRQADVTLSLLKLTTRLTYDSKALDQKKYLDLEQRLQEIGKMLGGWLKRTKENLVR